MDRSAYLKSVWSRYPVMPVQTEASGRIYSLVRLLKPEIELRLVLERGGTKTQVDFAKAPENSEYLVEGDIIAVVSANKIVLLAPQLSPLPIKKYDLDFQKKWESYLQQVRLFFRDKAFQEVKTPTLVSCPGTEPSLDVFSTELKIGSRRQKLFLPTSPELHLKKMMVGGAEKIFEIATCFRNGERTDRHKPEFLMLEWYRAYAGFESIYQDVEELVKCLCRSAGKAGPSTIKRYSVAELFEIHCDFKLTPQTSLDELKSLALKLGVDIRAAETIDDYFFLIFMDKIENNLPNEELIFVEKYPAYQAALARLTSDGWGDRFEVYWKGYELANAFHELNDPQIQRVRAQEDLDKKRQMGKEEIHLDEEFLVALQAGMPPSAGIALGLERLFMCIYDMRDISDLSFFPLK